MPAAVDGYHGKRLAVATERSDMTMARAGGGTTRMKARTQIRPESTLDRSRSRENRRAAGDGFAAEEEAVEHRSGKRRDPSDKEGSDPEGGVPRSHARP